MHGPLNVKIMCLLVFLIVMCINYNITPPFFKYGYIQQKEYEISFIYGP